MPDYKTAIAMITEQDNAFLFILALIVYAALTLYWLSQKHPRFGRVLSASAPALIPAVTLPYAPPLALFAVFTGLCARYIRIPLKRPLWAILGLALVLRLPLLGGPLWYDESFTNRLIHLPLSDFWPAIMADVHPPLYYAALWPLALLTDNPAALRLTSIIGGLLSVYLVYRVVMALGLGAGPAVWAALLWAILPANIYYSSELRSYIWLTVIVECLALAILKNQPGRFILLLGLVSWLHNMGILYAGVIGLAGLVYWQDRRWLRASIIGGLLSALWLPFLFQQANFVSNGHWAYINPGYMFWPLLTMTVGYPDQASLPALLLVVGGLTALSLVGLRGWFSTRRGLLWLVFVLSVPVLEVSLSMLYKPFFVGRHILPCMLLLTIAWAHTLFKSRLTRVMFVSGLTLALWGFYYNGVTSARPDFRPMLASCGAATTVYATSINAAFIASENGDRPVLLWPGARDNAQTVERVNMPKFDYAPAPIPPELVCIFEIEIPAEHETERAYIVDLLARFPHETTEYESTEWEHYNVHIIDLRAAPPPVDWSWLSRH